MDNLVPITRASFNLTRSCNLACAYCFTLGCTSGRMPQDIAFRGIDWLFRNAELLPEKDRSVEIHFWGGEPLLEWNLLQNMIYYAEDVSKQTAVPVNFGGTTNGTLLTRDKLDFLDQHKVSFMVSLDGTKETHDYNRTYKGSGASSHEVIVENLKSVLRSRPNTRVRMSVFSQRIDYFAEDVKYIIGLGCNYIMFSPVYESNFTDVDWATWEEQLYALLPYLKELADAGRNVDIEHCRTYSKADNSKWPCGSGRFYVHINHDGYLYSCHRAEKFTDTRPYMEQELCIGHIDLGITKPEVRNRFINFEPKCKGTSCYGTTPCWGGCYAVNFDFTGDISNTYEGICKYVEMQRRVSQKYVELFGDGSNSTAKQLSCYCYQSRHSSDPELDQKINLLATLLHDLNTRLQILEHKNGV